MNRPQVEAWNPTGREGLERTAAAFHGKVWPGPAERAARVAAVQPEAPSRKEPVRDGQHTHMDADGADSGHSHQDLASRITDLESQMNAGVPMPPEQQEGS
jgi:hypothetical protein